MQLVYRKGTGPHGRDELIRGVTRIDKERGEIDVFYLLAPNITASERKTSKVGVKTIEGDFRIEDYSGPMSRMELLAGYVRKNGWTRGAEIGVCKGNTTFPLVKRCLALHLLAVDFWPGKFAERGRMFKRLLSRCPDRDRITVIEKPSVDAAKDVANGSLDFVFIDADHSYEACLADIKAWAPKVRPGGLVSGHDINWDGVRRAVEEVYGEDYEEHQIDSVWLVEKPA